MLRPRARKRVKADDKEKCKQANPKIPGEMDSNASPHPR